jgi:serine/threonine protein kinase
MDVKSQEACTRWTELIHWASHLSTDSLYCIGRDNSSGMTNIPANGELGRGRYSTIYSATKAYFRQLSPADQMGWSSKYRALKVVSKDQFLYRVKRQRERTDTLLREVSVQALLSRYVSTTRSDSKTVPILLMFGMFETRSHLVLDLELVSGEDLFRHITTRSFHRHAQGGLSEEEACLIIRNILEALAILKKIGIAHRDVKPANIFMCNSHHVGGVRVKLGDFGMATFVDSDGLVKGRCGTPGYVAPEILVSDVNEGYHNKVSQLGDAR